MTDNHHTSTLSSLSSGESATIFEFKGGPAVNKRLASLGFTPGVSVTVEQNYHHGPLIVTVRGSQVAIGRGEANKIIVTK